MKEKIEHVKFIIDRFDVYMESTQTKSNLYLALNTAILGGIITLAASSKPEDVTFFSVFVLGCIAFLAVASITITLIAITPYLKSASDKSESVVFFQDVRNSTFDQYENRIKEMSEKKFLKDLTCQAYSLAGGLQSKYKRLFYAGRLIIIEFILLLIYAITLVTNII
ncbi:Pycsar system effector family protein [Flavobacterium oncorhynchi]|uniref:Pycsar system effector family protein n=1 Tax=Flavobacterium oncorhynchi TaxID=728056 RepID=UPI003519F184